MNYAVIMAGGSGQRLWPLSRMSKPKQIIKLFNDKSLLQHSVDRIRPLFDVERILVVTNAEYADVVRENLPELPPENILCEPVGRDTANAIGLAAALLKRKDPDAFMAVFSADHIIEPNEPLLAAVGKAMEFLQGHPEALFTFGIKATYAHTGFGYLKRADRASEVDPDIFPVVSFEEKPNKSTARKYIRSAKYCWNSGMFVWRVDTILTELEQRLPHNADRLSRIAGASGTDDYCDILKKEFPELEKISIDYGVLESAEHVFMCELDCHWVDVGSYEALADTIGDADPDDNIVTRGSSCRWLDSSNNIAISESPDHLIAGIGVENLVIVHTSDATLICRRDDTDSLKDLLDELAKDHDRRFL